MTLRSPFRSSGFYAIALVGWVAMTLLAVYVAAGAAIKDTERDFRAHATEVASEFRQKLHANEAVLSAFTAFLSAVDGGDRSSAVRFARSMLGAYPHIYMLEVARSVKGSEAQRFSQMMRNSWQSNFTIRGFNYSGDRQWTDAKEKREFWPLVFLYPDFPEARPVYGLDLDSVPHLSRALEVARRSSAPVSSTPFRLVEGEMAYVMFQAVGRPIRGGHHVFEGELVALLVVKTQILQPRWIEQSVGMRMQMLTGDPRAASLFERIAPPAHWTEEALLPRLSQEFDSGSPAQPVHLYFDRQVIWSDVSGIGLRSVAVLSLLSLALVMLYLRRHYQAMQRADVEHDRAEFLSMHDPLTGLPNRYLIADRVRQALLRQQRNGAMFALFMIDLDCFKEINDQYGHPGGDAVLVAVARRIEAALRSTDTVARYGGDEFIVLISDVVEGLNGADVVQVAEKLLHAVAQPIPFGDRSIDVTCSVGVAICPRDGDTLEALSRRADHAMYRVKLGGRNGVQVASEAV